MWGTTPANAVKKNDKWRGETLTSIFGNPFECDSLYYKGLAPSLGVDSKQIDLQQSTTEYIINVYIMFLESGNESIKEKKREREKKGKVLLLKNTNSNEYFGKPQ